MPQTSIAYFTLSSNCLPCIPILVYIINFYHRSHHWLKQTIYKAILNIFRKLAFSSAALSLVSNHIRIITAYRFWNIQVALFFPLLTLKGHYKISAMFSYKVVLFSFLFPLSHPQSWPFNIFVILTTKNPNLHPSVLSIILICFFIT